MPPKPQDPNTYPDGRKKPVPIPQNPMDQLLGAFFMETMKSTVDKRIHDFGPNHDHFGEMKEAMRPDEIIDDGYDDDAPVPPGMARPDCRCHDYERDRCINEDIPFASCQSFQPYKHMPWEARIGQPEPEFRMDILGQIAAGGLKCHRHEVWLTSSRGDHGIKVLFYPPDELTKNAALNKAYEQQIQRLQPGHTVYLVDPKLKFFMDMTKGIRFESPRFWVFKLGVRELMEEGRRAIHNMDALQHEVPKEMICTYCAKILSNPAQRVKCKCKAAFYCNAKCENAAFKAAHGKVCGDMGMVLWCAVVHRRRVVVDPTFPQSRRPPLVANPPTVAAAYHQATDVCPRYVYNAQHAETFTAVAMPAELKERMEKSVQNSVKMAPVYRLGGLPPVGGLHMQTHDWGKRK